MKWVETRVLRAHAPRAGRARPTSGTTRSRTPRSQPGGEIDDFIVHRHDGQDAGAELPGAEPGRVPQVPRERRDAHAARPARRSAQPHVPYPSGARRTSSRTGRASACSKGAPAPAQAPALPVCVRPVERQRRRARARVPAGQLLVLPRRRRRGAHHGPRAHRHRDELDALGRLQDRPSPPARRPRGRSTTSSRATPSSRSSSTACTSTEPSHRDARDRAQPGARRRGAARERLDRVDAGDELPVARSCPDTCSSATRDPASPRWRCGSRGRTECRTSTSTPLPGGRRPHPNAVRSTRARGRSILSSRARTGGSSRAATRTCSRCLSPGARPLRSASAPRALRRIRRRQARAHVSRSDRELLLTTQGQRFDGSEFSRV